MTEVVNRSGVARWSGVIASLCELDKQLKRLAHAMHDLPEEAGRSQVAAALACERGKIRGLLATFFDKATAAPCARPDPLSAHADARAPAGEAGIRKQASGVQLGARFADPRPGMTGNGLRCNAR